MMRMVVICGSKRSTRNYMSYISEVEPVTRVGIYLPVKPFRRVNPMIADRIDNAARTIDAV
jgi:hypothetical protein